VISGHTGVYDEEFEEKILTVKRRFENETDFQEPDFSNEVIWFLEETYGRRLLAHVIYRNVVVLLF
jgi:hypothetical protein